MVRKSIQRLSAADRAKAVLREDEVILMVISSSCVYVQHEVLNVPKSCSLH